MRPLLVLLTAAAFLGGAGGCGYGLVSYPKHADAPRVAIRNFDNESFDYGYEFVLADAMRKEFARRGAWRLVNDPEKADLVISGAIQPIVTRSHSFSTVVSTIEYEIGVVLDVQVQRPGTQQLGVDARVLREREIYEASADIEVTRRNREEALRRIASVMAERLHDVLYEVAPPPVMGTASGASTGAAPASLPSEAPASPAGAAGESRPEPAATPLPALPPEPPPPSAGGSK